MEIITMDPLERLPVEIHKQFLSYFEVDEAIQTLSLVSKKWYAAVASSDIMKKVLLNMKSKRKNDFKERVATLRWMSRTDGRPYQHVQLNCLLDIGISVESWAFLQTIANSIQTINIRSIKLDGQILNKFDIPKLEELRIMFIPRDGINSLISSTSMLKTLILRNEFPLCYDHIDYTPSEETIACVKKCLSQNKNLKELEIQGRPNVFAFFHQNLNEYRDVKVEKLTIKIEMSPGKIADNHRVNMMIFLSLQSESVKYLYIDQSGPQIIKHCLTKMKAVDFLRFDIELREPDKFSVKDLNLPANEKITKFELAYVVTFDELKEYLDLVPNVEEILIGHLNPRVIEYVGNHLEKLKSLVFRYDDCAGGHAECYKVFKLDNPEANHNIEFSLCNDFL